MKIVIFADGTGNAFTKQESNVWRLYRALDLSQKDQIARYIKGVGTSGFRPFALFDGATGVGVPANVRKLYRFICWTWNEGKEGNKDDKDDEIYMIGFSRGAFTIRSLIGLIDKEGLVPANIGKQPVSNAEMRRNSMAAWRDYRAQTVPLKKSLPAIWVTRWIRDACLAVYHGIRRHRSYEDVRKETERQNRSNVRIKFVGLFETVEAFGVPIEELRRAIDWAIWPISFRDGVLSERVNCARHALSLDDERTTFHPLRFDMKDEPQGVPWTQRRIKEVWFAGVHADVGGGYPDNSLTHVPLVWMAEAAEIEGLRFSAGSLEGFRARASSFGPIHDSREGLGVLYRYHPRPIDVNKKSGGPPVIHHSVVEKMLGYEHYAPITLPSSVLELRLDGSTKPIAGFPDMAKKMSSALDKDAVLPEPDEADYRTRAKLVSLTRDTIWWRRVTYYALLLAVLLAFSLPLSARPITRAFYSAVGTVAGWVGLRDRWDAVWDWLGTAQGGVSTNLHSISQTVEGLLPGYLKAWIDVVETWPLTSSAVVLIAFWLYQRNGVLRDRIVERAWKAWFPATASLTSKKSGQR